MEMKSSCCNIFYYQFYSTRKILKYAAKHLNSNEMVKLAEEMISSCNDDCERLRTILDNITLPKTILIQELIYEETTTGKTR